MLICKESKNSSLLNRYAKCLSAIHSNTGTVLQTTFSISSIHNVANGTAMFYLYHGLAKKGPNEVGSFSLDYLSANSSFVYLYKLCWTEQEPCNDTFFVLLVLTDMGRLKKIDKRSLVFTKRSRFWSCNTSFTPNRSLLYNERSNWINSHF